MTAETNPLDETVDMEYDNLNRLVLREKVLIDSEYGPFLRQQEEWVYDAASQVIEYENFLGQRTGYDYDNLSRLIEATLPDPDGGGGQTSPVYAFEYDAIGNVLVEIDALANETVHDYDNLHRLVSTTLPDPDGGGGQSAPVWQFAYNQSGWLTKVTDPLSRETTYTLDNLGRRTKTTMPDPDGGGGQAAAEYSVVYDAANNVVSETNPLGKTTNYDYDALHRLIETQLPDPDGGGALGRPTTTFEYDAAGNLLSLTDPVGNETTWVYDGLDRVTSETNELAAARTYEYDALNRVVEYTDRRGLVTQFDYDFWGRLVEETWLDGVTTVNTLEFRYDLANSLLEADDDASAFDFTFDNLSRLLTSVDASGGPTVRLSQTWDSNSNRAALEAEVDSGGGYAADFLNEYTWDNLSRMTRVEQSDSGAGGVDVSEKRVDFAYNAVNQFTTITRYEDLAATDLVATSTYSYDNAHRLTALTHAKGVTTLADYDWTYDVSSRVTSFTNNLYSAETATYSYDHTDQLTAADRTGSGNDEAFAFDENGNRTITGYVTGDGNLLLSDGTFDYEYDSENNRVRKENISTGEYVLYFWDHRNRLTAIEFRDDADELQKRVEYDYDVFDRRIFKRVDDDGDGIIDRAYRYVYDHAGKFDTATGVPLDDIILIFTDPDGEGEDDFELSNRLLHGPAVDQVLADEQFVAEVFDDIYWALPDNQGTIRDLVDYNPGNDTTTSAKHLAFASFGEITSDSSPSLSFLHAYTGREWDPDAQLYFYRARPYDAVTGEFLSDDPESFGAGDTNLGRYVGNSTTNHTDPSGRGFLDFVDWLDSKLPFSSSEMRAVSEARAEVYERTTGVNYGNMVTSGLQIVGGVGEAVWGGLLLLAPEPTGASKAAGWALFMHGLDNIGAGAQGLQSGTPQPAMTTQFVLEYGHNVVPGAGGPEMLATAVDLAPSLAGAAVGAPPTTALPLRPVQPPPPLAASGSLHKGATIYRVHGGASDEFGRYWTTVDPTAVPNYRAGAGLPSGNTGQSVTVGILDDLDGVVVKPAVPGPNTPPGAVLIPEVIVPHPPLQIKPTATFDVDPPF